MLYLGGNKAFFNFNYIEKKLLGINISFINYCLFDKKTVMRTFNAL